MLINHRGDLAFSTNLRMGNGINTTNDVGVWAGPVGEIGLVIRGGDPLPGFPGVQLGPMESMGIPLRQGPDGLVLFLGFATGPGVGSTNRTCLIAGTSLGAWVVARDGFGSPALPADTVIKSVMPLDKNFMCAGPGQVVFHASLAGNITADNDAAIILATASNQTLVAREGDPCPGLPGVWFKTLLPNLDHFLSANPAGMVTFAAEIDGFGVTGDNDQSLWVYDGSQLILAAREGDALPGRPDLVFDAFGHTSCNIATQLCFNATFKGGPESAIVVGEPQHLQVLAQAGTPAPGMPTGVLFATGTKGPGGLQRHPSINALGVTIFATGLSGFAVSPSMTDAALYVGKPGALVPVARLGDPAADTPPGTVYGRLGLSDFSPFSLNDRGQVVFKMDMDSPSLPSAERQGIWAGLPGHLRRLPLQGHFMDLGEGDVRKLFPAQVQIWLAGQEGLSNGVNNQGQVLSLVGIEGREAAIVMIQDLEDPDRDGLPAIIEDAFGKGLDESASTVLPDLYMDGSQPVLVFRKSNGFPLNRLRIEATSDFVDWHPLSVIPTLASDQSVLPPAVQRYESRPAAGDWIAYRVAVLRD